MTLARPVRNPQGAGPAAGIPSPEWGETFTRRLLDWYRRQRRDLPWRANCDPYRIWVSEAMLQQTRVETAVPYFLRFLELFPTVAALAEAPEEQVLKAWEGLGYYSRARRLQEAAREVQARYGGRVPDDPAAFAALPGVGRYTTGAVLSIAYGLPLPAVDGNVTRVLSRLLLIRQSPDSPAVRAALEETARALIPPGQAGDFNQALMELGALVCRPKAPRCDTCPVVGLCRGQQVGEQEALPIRKARPALPTVRLAGLVLLWEGRVLVRQRPESGLLAGLWEFPNWPVEPGETLPAALRRGFTELGLAPGEAALLLRVRHAFSHLRWDLQAFFRRLGPEEDPPAAESPKALRWVDVARLEELPLPVPMARVRTALAAGRLPGGLLATGRSSGLQKRLDGLDTVC